MRITLSEEDAQRLGCPRHLEFDPTRIMGSDLIALEEQLGWDIEKLEAAMQGEPAVNAIGEPVWETDDKGKLVLDDKGKPQQQRAMKARTVMAITWLCVRRANPAVRWDGFDFAVTGTEFIPDEPEGKAPSPPGTTTGKRRSPRSSATRRGSSGTS